MTKGSGSVRCWVILCGDDGLWTLIRGRCSWASNYTGIPISFSIRFLLTARQAKSSDDKKRAKAFSSYIISIALAESAAIYGLVLGLQGAPMSDCITFFVIGFVAIILQPPTVLFPSREDDYRSKLRE